LICKLIDLTQSSTLQFGAATLFAEEVPQIGFYLLPISGPSKVRECLGGNRRRFLGARSSC